jgi:hypothetical protein
VEEDQERDQVPDQVNPPASSADLVQMIAIMEHLAEENRRLSEQNVQLAGQLGFTTAQLQQAQERIALCCTADSRTGGGERAYTAVVAILVKIHPSVLLPSGTGISSRGGAHPVG